MNILTQYDLILESSCLDVYFCSGIVCQGYGRARAQNHNPASQESGKMETKMRETDMRSASILSAIKMVKPLGYWVRQKWQNVDSIHLLWMVLIPNRGVEPRATADSGLGVGLRGGYVTDTPIRIHLIFAVLKPYICSLNVLV